MYIFSLGCRIGHLADSLSHEYRLGYEAFFTERQMVLQALYDSIEDKSRLVPNKRVVAVGQTDEGATLVAHDGTKITCEIVAGADGVRSVIRHEILERERIPENPMLRKCAFRVIESRTATDKCK